MRKQMCRLVGGQLPGGRLPSIRLPGGRLLYICLILFFGIAMIANPLPAGADDSRRPIIGVGDLDGDGVMEEYCLTEETIIVKKDDQELWKSPDDWQVQAFTLGDVNNDGHTELVFSLWKKGSFGKIRPFWHTGNDDSYKNHLFVYKLEGNIFKPVWCSSDLDRPILSIDILDINGDGLNELVVDEGQYCKVSESRYSLDPYGAVQTNVWKWNQWGFSFISRAWESL